MLGISDRIHSLHKEWLGSLQQDDVLDLGCFTGNALSTYLAENANSYIGIDLSDSAIRELNEKLSNFDKAVGIANDFFCAGFKDGQFSVIYAHSVLHHFKDFEALCAELHRILRPGGVIISLDPTQTEPLNRLARIAYRPFQSDKDWEWPFKVANYRTLDKYFHISGVQGYRGFSKAGYIFPSLAKWGIRLDEKYATKVGLALYSCWVVTLRMEKV